MLENVIIVHMLGGIKMDKSLHKLLIGSSARSLLEGYTLINLGADPNLFMNPSFSTLPFNLDEQTIISATTKNNESNFSAVLDNRDSLNRTDIMIRGAVISVVSFSQYFHDRYQFENGTVVAKCHMQVAKIVHDCLHSDTMRFEEVQLQFDQTPKGLMFEQHTAIDHWDKYGLHNSSSTYQFTEKLIEPSHSLFPIIFDKNANPSDMGYLCRTENEVGVLPLSILHALENPNIMIADEFIRGTRDPGKLSQKRLEIIGGKKTIVPRTTWFNGENPYILDLENFDSGFTKRVPLSDKRIDQEGVSEITKARLKQLVRK